MAGTAKTLMIYGQQWVPKSYFDKHYAERIKQVFLNEPDTRFVLGAAAGVDSFAQQLLMELCGHDHTACARVTVFDKAAKDGRLSSLFSLQNGFATYPERDAAMHSAASEHLCVLAQYGGATSGCAYIVLLAHFHGNTEKASGAAAALRLASEPYSKAQEQRVSDLYASLL